MSGVCGLRLAFFHPDLHSIIAEHVHEPVSSDAFFPGEVVAIHHPYFKASYTRILFSRFSSELQSERFSGNLYSCRVIAPLVISLLAYASQFAQPLNRIILRGLCVQVVYCLAPAFFLMLTLNCFSATLIISL